MQELYSKLPSLVKVKLIIDWLPKQSVQAACSICISLYTDEVIGRVLKYTSTGCNVNYIEFIVCNAVFKNAFRLVFMAALKTFMGATRATKGVIGIVSFI